MKQNLYFIHPITASFDPRMEAMEEKLHGKGYGGYWYIREKMSLFLHDRCRLKDLKPFATKYFSFKLMKTIVMESDLFYFEGEYIVAKELNCEGPQTTVTDPSKKHGNQGKNTPKTRKTTKKQAKIDENSTDSSKKQAKNSKKTSENDGKQPENDPKQPEKPCNSSEKPTEKEDNTQKNSALGNTDCASGNTDASIIYIEKEREKEITAEKEEEKETADTDADNPNGADSNGTSPGSSGASPGSSGALPGSKPPKPVCAWQQHLDALGTDSQWTDIACMKSGFGLLMKKHFAQAKEFFRNHVIAYGKGPALVTEQDVMSYFMNFATNAATSKELRSHLQALEQSAPPHSSDPYRHEQRLDGHRICNGHRIPDEAPPRPDDHSRWNDAPHRWEPEYG